MKQHVSGGSRICQSGGPWRARSEILYNGGPGGGAPEGPGAESLVGAKAAKLFVRFHTKEGPKVKDLNEMI